MHQTIRKKNTKVLSPLGVIEFLKLLKTEEIPAIAEHFEMSVSAVYRQQRKLQAYDDDRIDRKIDELERRMANKNYDYPPRDYKKQEECDHLPCTLMIACTCTLRISENEIDRAIEILIRKKEYLQSHKPIEIKL